MAVRARVKIIEVKSFEEVEKKVNDFLAFSEDIEHVARIVYQLEYNVVIVEYYVFAKEREGEREIILTEYDDDDYDVPITISTNPYLNWWLRFFFPNL